MIRIINFQKETVFMNQNVMYLSDFTTLSVYCGRNTKPYITALLEGQFPKNAEETDFGQSESASKAIFNLLCTVATWTKVMGKQLQKQRRTNPLLENKQKTFWHRVL